MLLTDAVAEQRELLRIVTLSEWRSPLKGRGAFMSLRSRLAISIAATAFGFQAVLSLSPAAAQTPAETSTQTKPGIALPTVRVQAAAPRKLRRVRRATPAARTTQRQTPVAPPPQSAQSAQGPSGSASMGSLSTAAAAFPPAAAPGRGHIAQTPIASYGDIFRALPGFEVANYGQGAIGYGLSMRGYTNAEHGRDIAYYIDGVPVNDISSIDTPNYADLNILMPETVQSIEVVRGPFDVECGDLISAAV